MFRLHISHLQAYFCQPSHKMLCTILNSVRQHNHFITQGNYKATCFDYILVIFRPIFVNRVTRCYAHIVIPCTPQTAQPPGQEVLRLILLTLLKILKEIIFAFWLFRSGKKYEVFDSTKEVVITSYKIHVSVKHNLLQKIMFTGTCFDSNELSSGHPKRTNPRYIICQSAFWDPKRLQ